MSDIAISVQGIGKAYRIGARESRPDTAVGAILALLSTPWRNFRSLRSLNTSAHRENADSILWALRDVSFEVRQGEAVGIIGRNGAGKSTLLKILSRIVEPTEGRAEIRGRVSSLLEVGTGFHPELTGRENVYMNGTILGMKRAEITRKFHEIVAFSGVEKFLDTPVKRYSSGMKVRLAFAVAAHLEPEILIVDEVLAVGDAEFRRRCLGKMQDVAGDGKTVLFVSHQLEALSNLCSRAILLETGQVVRHGPTEAIIEHYLGSLEQLGSMRLAERQDRTGSGGILLHEVWMENRQGQRATTVRIGDFVRFVIRYDIVRDDPVSWITAGIAINSLRNVQLILLRNDHVGDVFHGDIPRSGHLECEVESLPLNVGTYTFNASVESVAGLEDWVPHVGNFDVSPGDFFGTGKLPDSGRAFVLQNKWTLKP